MTVWLLPDNIADMLPRQARTMERMRRTCLDLFEVHGFELVKPPLIEYADSLLTGSGRDVTNNTFRFMDQTNGRVVGIRADMTPQIARIDAHILNRRYAPLLRRQLSARASDASARFPGAGGDGVRAFRRPGHRG